MNIESKAAERNATRLKILIQSLRFDPEQPITAPSRGRAFRYKLNFFYCDSKSFSGFIDLLGKKYPSVAEETLSKYVTRTIESLLNDLSEIPDINWDNTYILGEIKSSFPTEERVFSAIRNLFDTLRSLIRHFKVFVPITGIELSMPQYDFGAVMLVRTSNLIAADEAVTKSRIGPFSLGFQSQCIVEIHVEGDASFARLEGIKLAEQLAIILNLHFVIPFSHQEYHNAIRCLGSPTSYTNSYFLQTAIEDNDGHDEMVNLPAIENRHQFNRKINQASLNKVKQSGFDEIWECFKQTTKKQKSLNERIRRSIVWFDKAVNFNEPDAQFVGLATALEILLISDSTINNIFSTWAGITQQLADRCAFLLGHDLESTIDVAKQVKELYKVRSGIVHGGKEPDLDKLDEMAQLTRQVILTFVQKGYSSFEDFEDWIKRLQYSVNIHEIHR